MNIQGFRLSNKGIAGNRAAHLAEIEFKDVRIPRDNVIGKPGAALALSSHGAGSWQIQCCMGGVAIAQEALDCMATYARKRKQFGRKIGEYQLIQRMICNAVTQTHAARALCVKAGEMRLQRQPGSFGNHNC